MKIIGDPMRFAFEVGDYTDSRFLWRHIDIWAGGVRLCVDDSDVDLGQFTNDLADELKGNYRIDDFSKYLRGLSPVEMALFVCSTRDENSPNYDLENDMIYPCYHFLKLGPTTDNLSSFLFRDIHKSFLVYSFWRETEKTESSEVYHVVELDFEEIQSVMKTTLQTLLDT